MLQFKQGNLKEQKEEHCYNRDDFQFRLKKLQKVVGKSSIDGILIINGIDSKRNEENEKITKWLICGLNGLNVLNSYMDEIFDEIVILITQEKVYFYTEKLAYDYLSKFFGLPNVEVFLNDNEDQDIQEVEKIAFFLRTVKNIKKVGMIPSKRDKNNVKNIEKWPLLQAYSLEGTGRGYFSQQHQIVNVGIAVNELYKQYDKYSLEEVIRKGDQLNYSIQRVKNEYIKVRSRDLHKYDSGYLTSILGEQSEVDELTENVKEVVKPWSKPYIEKRNESVLLVENMDICTKLRVARTYFTCQNNRSQVTSVEEDIDPDTDQVIQYRLIHSERPQYVYQNTCINSYYALIAAFNKVVNELSVAQKNLSSSYIKNRLKTELNQEVNVMLAQYNSLGEQVTVDAKDTQSYKLSTNMHCLRVSMDDLIYAQSFLILEDSVMVLTESVPDIEVMLTDSKEKGFFEEYAKLRYRVPVDIVGQQLKYKDRHDSIPGVTVQVGQLVYSGRLKVYERGVVVDSDALGYLFIPFYQIAHTLVSTGAIQFQYSSPKDKPVLQSIPYDSLTLSLDQHQVLSTIVSLIKGLSLSYSYSDIPSIQAEQQEQQGNLDYLQYRQNMHFNKTVKAMSIAAFQKGQLGGESGESGEDERVQYILVEGRDIEQPVNLAMNVQKTLMKEDRQVVIYQQKNASSSLEQEVNQMKQMSNNLKKGDIMVIVLLEGLQQELTSVEIEKAGGCLLLRVTKLCTGQRDPHNMISLIRHYLVPGYTQAYFVDQQMTSQSGYDCFLTALRQWYPNINIVLSVNNKFDQQALVDTIKQSSYQSSYQGHLRSSHSHLIASPSPTPPYAFISHRLPIDIHLFTHFMQNVIMKMHQGHLYDKMEFKKEDEQMVDKSQMKDEELLNLQMELLHEKVKMDDQSSQVLRIDSIQGLLLDNASQQVTSLQLDSHWLTSSSQPQYTSTTEQILVKTRTYDVQIYSPPVALGLTI